jgi:peptide/nickel transport system ATP-binding protein
VKLEANNLGFFYTKDRWIFRSVSLSFSSGCRTALLGESGAGKTTLAKVLAAYEKPSEGTVQIDGTPFTGKKREYRSVQLISQHPEKAINPRFRMKDVLAECYGKTNIDALLEKLGIEREWLNRYPGELSGGEQQRFCIARALCEQTRFIIADELSAMLDPVTQAQLWAVLLDECNRRNIGLIAITHDAALAQKICNDFINIESLFLYKSTADLPHFLTGE